MKRENKTDSRRKFLLTAGLGSAGAAAVALSGNRIASGTPVATTEPQSQGYHLSEHILKYYKTTQV
jgi:hypothetical protein